MKAARVPAGPILSTADIYAEEQYHARGTFQEISPPEGGLPITAPAMHPVRSPAHAVP